MSTDNSVEPFYANLALVIDTLKLHNSLLVNYCEQRLASLFGSNYTNTLFTAAILELSDTDPHTCSWAIDHCSEIEGIQQLIESVTHYAIHKLIKQGLVIGQDFSLNGGQILLNHAARAVLIDGVSSSDRILLEKILVTPTPASSLTL